MLSTCMTGLVGAAPTTASEDKSASDTYDIVLMVDIGAGMRGTDAGATRGAEVLAASIEYMLSNLYEEANAGKRTINLSVVAFSSDTSTFFQNLDLSTTAAKAECDKVVQTFKDAAGNENNVSVKADNSATGASLKFWNGGAVYLRYALEKANEILATSTAASKSVILCTDANSGDINQKPVEDNYKTLCENNVKVYPIGIKGRNSVNLSFVSKLAVDLGDADATSFIANDGDAIPRVFIKVLAMIFNTASNESEKVEVTKGRNYTFKFRVLEGITKSVLLNLSGAPVNNIQVIAPDNIDHTNDYGKLVDTGTRFISEYEVTNIRNGEWTIKFVADETGSVYFDAIYHFYNLSIESEVVNYASVATDGFIIGSDDLLTMRGYIYNNDEQKRVTNSEVYNLSTNYSLSFVDSKNTTDSEAVYGKPSQAYYEITLSRPLAVNTYDAWISSNLDLTELCGITMQISGKETAPKLYVNYITLVIRELSGKTTASRNETLSFVFELYSDVNKENKLTDTPAELIGKNVTVICYKDYNHTVNQGTEVARSDAKTITADFLTTGFKVDMKGVEIGTLTFVAYVYGNDISNPDVTSDNKYQVGIETSTISDLGTIKNIDVQLKDGETYEITYKLSEAFRDSDGDSIVVKEIVNANEVISTTVSQDGKSVTLVVKGGVNSEVKLVVTDSHGAELAKTIKVKAQIIKPTITVNGAPADINISTYINNVGKLDAAVKPDIIDLSQYFTHSFGNAMSVKSVKFTPAADKVSYTVDGLKLALTVDEAFDGTVTVTVADEKDDTVTAELSFALKVSAKPVSINTNDDNKPDKIKVKLDKGATFTETVDLSTYLTSSDGKALTIVSVFLEPQAQYAVTYTIDGMTVTYTIGDAYSGKAVITVADNYGSETTVEISISSKIKTSPIVIIIILAVILVVAVVVVFLIDKSKKVKSLSKTVIVTIFADGDSYASSKGKISTKKGLGAPTTVKLTNKFIAADAAIVSAVLKNIEIKGCGLFGSGISCIM